LDYLGGLLRVGGCRKYIGTSILTKLNKLSPKIQTTMLKILPKQSKSLKTDGNNTNKHEK